MVKISFERVVTSGGEKKLRLVGMEGVLGERDLPKLYFEKDAYFSPCGLDGVSLVSKTLHYKQTLYVNDLLTPSETAKVINILQEGAKNLREAKRELQELEKEWNGTVEYIF